MNGIEYYMLHARAVNRRSRKALNNGDLKKCMHYFAESWRRYVLLYPPDMPGINSSDTAQIKMTSYTYRPSGDK